ncbi:MAG: FHA domain-containing protein [Pseudobdellovibrionaceae bacterium]
MWAIRILNGPQAGQIFSLKQGRNVVGRSPAADIQILSQGISKEHCEIHLQKNQMSVVDLKSSNGTFLNGVKIQNAHFRIADKISLFDILLEVIPATQSTLQAAMATDTAFVSSNSPSGSQQASGAEMATSTADKNLNSSDLNKNSLLQLFHHYMQSVALPGVYKLAHVFEFRFVVLFFIGLFILSTTLLSMIPMVEISRSSILVESKRRAQSLARSVAMVNQAALLQNSYSALTTNATEAEDGVKQVLIIQQSDGMILAPASRAGTTADLPFVHAARRENRSQTVEVDSTTVGASYPIGLFDPNTGEQIVKAHAIIIYDMGSLAFDDGRVISLFMQTLVLAIILGSILFYFLYKLIEYPLLKLNAELDQALRDKKDSIEFSIQFPTLQALLGNINSLLSRYIHGGSESITAQVKTHAVEQDVENLMLMVGYPAVVLSKDCKMISCNLAFENVLRQNRSSLLGQSIEVWSDPALKQNIQSLVVKSLENPAVLQSDSLEFSGHLCELRCQNMDSWMLIVVVPVQQGAAA